MVFKLKLGKTLLGRGRAMSQCSGLSSQCDVQVIITETESEDVDKTAYQRPAYVAVALILAMTTVSVFFPMVLTACGLTENIYSRPPPAPCTDPCRITLVESIPENLTFAPGSPVHLSTYEGWLNLLEAANKTVDIASFYWTLRGSDFYKDPSDWQGEDIYRELMAAGKERGIRIRIAQNVPSEMNPNLDTADLAKQGAAEVRSLNFTRWFGGGVLHTKLWVVDGKHFYVGSANMDWRSLTQVKELGAVVYNCSCLAADVQRLFDVYWYMGEPGATPPSRWPTSWDTHFNAENPIHVKLNDTPSGVYLSSAPTPFCTNRRTRDLSAILNVTMKANGYIYIAVMDYFPTTLYTKPRRFWPLIDDALRTAALERNVSVRVMASWWNHSRPDLPNYLKSLEDLDGAMGADIQVRLFHVPATASQSEIPFARVNHNKYMVTDNTAYIGTSNWSGDYFINTAGVGLVVNDTGSGNGTSSVRQQLTAIFERDWNSPYALPVGQVLTHWPPDSYTPSMADQILANS